MSMQSKNSGFFFKNSGHVKRDCRKCAEWGVRKTEKFAEGNKNNPIKKNESYRQNGNNSHRSNNRKSMNITCYNCNKTGHFAQKYKEQKKNNEGGGRVAELKKPMVDLKKKLIRMLFL